jgi:ketosteroid isomerase-like protein
VILSDDDKLAAQAAYAAATRAGDVDALAAISEPDAVVWHNHDDAVVPADRSGRVLRWLHRVMPDVAWHDVAVLPTPAGFVWRATITGTGPDGPVRVPTCMVVRLSASGRVQRTDEYLDPAPLVALTDTGARS